MITRIVTLPKMTEVMSFERRPDTTLSLSRLDPHRARIEAGISEPSVNKQHLQPHQLNLDL
jgi:hypothetical protein